MSDEWFHFKKIKSDKKKITEEASEEYAEILPKCIETVTVWWNSYPSNQKSGWEVKANLSDGIYVKSPDDLFDSPIVMKSILNNMFNVGWRHRYRESLRDPKEEIAEKLFTIINNSSFLKKCIVDFEVEEFERKEFEMEEFETEEFERKEFEMEEFEREDKYGIDPYDFMDNSDYDEFTPHSGYYYTGTGDYVYCFQGDQKDCLACDLECGYCGRCPY